MNQVAHKELLFLKYEKEVSHKDEHTKHSCLLNNMGLFELHGSTYKWIFFQ